MANVQDVENHAGGEPVNGNLTEKHNPLDLGAELSKIRTAGGFSMTPDFFEKIYLQPKNRVSNNLRSTFANPTPLALVGLLLSLTPFSNVLLEWRGSGGLGAANVGTYYFFGGLLMIISSVLEFFIGNTFPFVVFGSFGAFWLSLGATFTPYFNAAIAYQPDDPGAAMANPTFATTFAFFPLYMAVLCFFYMILAIRTNLCFLALFTLMVPGFACLAAYFWKAAEGISSPHLAHAAGGIMFTVSLVVWYLFFAQLLEAVDFPISLPVFDLSRFIKGASDKTKDS